MVDNALPPIAAPAAPPGVTWRVIDFDALEGSVTDLEVDDVFCTLGTTMKQAGSKDAFRKVDHDYVLALARAGLAAGGRKFVLNSSVGADPRASSFYLRVKGEVEAAVRALGYETFVTAQPSLLLSDRAESRPGERIGVALAPALNPLMLGPLKRYKAIDVDTVAAALVGAALELGAGQHALEYEDLVRLAAEA